MLQFRECSLIWAKLTVRIVIEKRCQILPTISSIWKDEYTPGPINQIS
jgi:hypothetical protein